MERWIVLPQNSQVLAVHAALLHTGAKGQILYFSGDEHDQGQHDRNQIDHTRLFNCSDFTLSNPGSPSSDVFCSGHAFLADGRLLVAGGTEAFPGEVGGPHHPHFPGLRNTWVYDPVTRNWRQMAMMNPEPGRSTGGGRWYPTLLTLPNGQVLAMSGHPSSSDTRHDNNSPEAFVPTSPTGTWILLGPDDPAHEVSYYPRLHLLPNGDVFSSNPAGPSRRTQRLKPTTAAWTDITGGPPDAFYDGFAGSSVLLPLLPENGYRPRVLLCGGSRPLVIDLGAASPIWQFTAPRALVGSPLRNHLNAVLLPTGDVFVCGGVAVASTDASAVRQAELYIPDADRWSTMTTATVPRNYHSVALLMPDGRVWTAGSNHDAQQSFPIPGVDNRELRIEIYEPAYFSSTRPQITAAPTTLDYGQTFEVRTPQAGSIRRVALVRAGSATHAFNPDQRYVGLAFTRAGPDRLSVTAPPHNRIAPPGYYLLFVVDANRIPSEGKFVWFNTPLPAGNPALVQGRFGARGNFEVAVPLAAVGLAHFWRNNDNPSLPWNGPTVFGTAAGRVDAVSLIQSNFGSPGNLEVVARAGNRLVFFWRDSGPAFIWNGPFPIVVDSVSVSGVDGNPVLIQSRFGTRGNFELVVPRVAGGLAFYWRDNDNPSLPWHGPTVFGTGAGRVDAVSLIQSTFSSPGNLEVVARTGGGLLFFWRDSGPRFIWNGPFPIVADGVPVSGVAGNPVLIQSRFGTRGNFELVVPRAAGGLAFYWRDNDNPSLPWHGPTVFGTGAGRVDAISLIQSNFGNPGNLEVVARVGNRLALFWRDSGPGFVWNGPFFFAPIS